MGWTFQFDEIDKEVTKDSSTPGRFTFKRYMYFKPDQYDNWSKKQSYSGTPYTAELVGNSSIPSAGTYLTGPLAAFYVRDIISITNLTTEEHGDHCSYAQVTLEYENIGSVNQEANNSSSHQESKSLKPWERKVEDFSILNQEIQVPMTTGYSLSRSDDALTGTFRTLANTAGQPFYGQTEGHWIQRLTWTYFTLSGNFAMEEPLLNNADVTLFNKIKIPANAGLLLPPSFRQLYFYKNNDDTHPQAYEQWNFEIIVDSFGFDKYLLNTGTKAIISGELVDICSWYVYDPNSSSVPLKKFGTFKEMMEERADVNEDNKQLSNENDKYVWSGDFVQSPVPLLLNGGIDTYSILHPDSIQKLKYRTYKTGTWNLGIR